MTETMDTEPGCVDRVRSVGGGWKLRGGRQRDKSVHDGVWSRHVNRVAEHVRPANTRRLINIKLRNRETELRYSSQQFEIDAFCDEEKKKPRTFTSKKKEPRLFDFFFLFFNRYRSLFQTVGSLVRQLRHF